MRFLSCIVRASAALYLLMMASVLAAPSEVLAAADWTLTFEDNFSGDSLNASYWNVAHNMTHGPEELQLYLADEVYLDGGDLVLRTRRRRAHLNATFV